MKATTHLFDIEDAQKYGLREAIILYNIRHWLEKNRANNKNIIEGRVWTYNSAAAFSELFPYMTEPQIRRSLKKLLEDGILIKGEHNKKNYDRTSWYSVDEDRYIVPSDESVNSISRNRDIHLTKSSHGTDEIVTPIPDINTDSKQQIVNTYTKAPKAQPVGATDHFVKLWNYKHGTAVKLTPDKERQVKARLKVFTPEEIQQAIENRSRDPWFQAEGAKFYGDWESFWRNDSKVERYLNRRLDMIDQPGDLPF